MSAVPAPAGAAGRALARPGQCGNALLHHFRLLVAATGATRCTPTGPRLGPGAPAQPALL